MATLPGLPKAAEYALKILTCLALGEGRPIPASSAARCVRIPASQASKTLHYLTLRGLTCAHRGSKGGYLLMDSAEEIRVEQVLDLFRLPDHSSEASRDPLLQVWSDTSGRCLQAWEQLTIAELARRTASEWNCAECAEQLVFASDFSALDRTETIRTKNS